MLDTVNTYANRMCFSLHPTKSQVTGKQDGGMQFKLGKATLPHTDKITHLGIDKHLKSLNSLVENRIDLARRVAYTLMPVGLHGENGLSIPAARKLINSFVQPRLLPGLEAVVLF